MPLRAQAIALLTGLAVLGGLALFAVGCSGGDAPRGRLVFISRFNGGYDIRAPGPGHQPSQTLTEVLPWDAAPVWSPDGTRLAFYADRVFNLPNRDDNVDIYVAQADGSGLRRLTEDHAPDAFPVWSPDSSRIAFYSEANDERDGDVYVMDADGSNLRRLTNTRGLDIPYEWSPDGSRLLFGTNRNGNFDIYEMDADGQNQDRLTGGDKDDFAATRSPDGSRIAYQSGDMGNMDIFIMEPNGDNKVNMTLSPLDDTMPVWAADSRRLAFVSERDGNSEVYIMDTVLSYLTRITVAARPDLQVAWSPGGVQIAFVSNRDLNAELYIASADGRALVRVTDDPGWDSFPAWSPDGTQIAFSSHRQVSFDDVSILADADHFVDQAAQGNVVSVQVIGDEIRYELYSGSTLYQASLPSGETLQDVLDEAGVGPFDIPFVDDSLAGGAFSGDADEGDYSRRDVYLIDADGSDLVRLTNDGVEVSAIE